MEVDYLENVVRDSDELSGLVFHAVISLLKCSNELLAISLCAHSSDLSIIADDQGLVAKLKIKKPAESGVLPFALAELFHTKIHYS